MIDLYIYCNTVRLFSLCLPLLDVGIDSLQEHLEIHLQKYSVRLVVLCLEECRPEIRRQEEEEREEREREGEDEDREGIFWRRLLLICVL